MADCHCILLRSLKRKLKNKIELGNISKRIPLILRYRANVYAVDPFLGGYDPVDLMSTSFDDYAADAGLDLAATSEAWGLAMAFDLTSKVGCRYHLLRETSVNAAVAFSDGSVDIIFVDGLHT